MKRGWRRFWRVFLLLMLIALVGGGWWTANLIWYTPGNINLFYERVFILYALDNPEMLSSLRILEPYGIDFHNSKLADVSDAHAHELIQWTAKQLQILRSYDRKNQTPSQLLSTDILDWYLDDTVRGEQFMYDNYPVNQLFGIQNDYPTFMATTHQITTKREAEQYIARLTKVRVQFEQVMEGLHIRESKGILPPKFVIDRVLTEMKAFVGQELKSNILYSSAKEKLDKAKGISDADKTELLHQIERAIRDSVYPAYNTFVEYFTALESKATTDDGVWKFPDGAAFYAYALRSNTTTDMTPEQVHATGLSEVARVEGEMRTILDGLGMTGKTVGEDMVTLRDDPKFKYPNSDEGKKQCLADYQTIIDEVDKGLSDAFDIRPKVGVKVEPIPAFKEKTAPGAYYDAASLDGVRPGVFYANLRDMNEVSKWAMKTLAYHEAIPGHHFQIGVQQAIEGVPTFRRVLPFTAYTEGWALYAERLAWELGFEKDPYENLGRLQAELFRSVRLVVDTGIHSKHWTREQAIKYMKDTTGMPEKEVTAEIERYIVNPGQACAYKVGMMKILELREKAKQELGDKFSLKAYHNVVLQNGAMPLTILEQVVNEWIAKTKGS